jgi:hypothetical protein
MATAARQAEGATARTVNACWRALQVLVLEHPPQREFQIMSEPKEEENPNVVPFKPIEGCVISQSEYEAYVAALDDIRTAIDRAEKVVRGVRFGNGGLGDAS